MLYRLIQLLSALALVAGFPTDPFEGSARDVPTYWDSVHPLVTRRCLPCHAEGGPAPFALDTYERARPHALLMSVVAASHTMPLGAVASEIESADWKPLNSEEILTLKRWVNAGAREGQRPIIRTSEASHFTESPDRVLKFEPIDVPLTGAPVWRTLDLRFEEDFPIRHFELDWGSGKVARAIEMEVLHGTDNEFLGRSMVGQPPLRKRLNPKTIIRTGDFVRFHLRIHPDGQTRKIAPHVGLYRGESSPIERSWEALSPAVKLAPGETRNIKTEISITDRRWLETLVPPSTPWIRRAVIYWIHPEQGRKVLAKFDVWRPDNYGALRFRPSLELPAGSRIEADVFYDNTIANPLIEKSDAVDLGGLSGRQQPSFKLKLVEGPAESRRSR